VIRNVAQTFEYTQLQNHWNIENSKLTYKCPEKLEKNQSEGFLLYTWHIVSSANIFRALQIGKMLKLSSKGIGAKDITNDKIKSTIMLAHSIGFIFDHILKPEEILGETAGKLFHYAPDLLATPSLNIYRIWNKGLDSPTVLKEASLKLLHLTSFVLSDHAKTRYESTLEKLCRNSSELQESKIERLPIDNSNMNIDNLEIAGERIEEKEDL
jgi:hypothetical protein